MSKLKRKDRKRGVKFVPVPAGCIDLRDPLGLMRPVESKPEERKKRRRR